MIYLCPICAQSLQLLETGKGYGCSNRHQFDLAKQGYLHLLPVQHKHSKQPGDNQDMMQARRAFLEAGHYLNLAAAIAELIVTHRIQQKTTEFLDLGCGEGYYSRQLSQELGGQLELVSHGLDISKVAIAAAAKKQPEVRFVVASSHRLPYVDNFFDVVLCVFAPANLLEIKRVLKPSGLLLTVSPGPRHLWQLKELIYADVHNHAAPSNLPDGFKVIHSRRIQNTIIPSGADRLALLQMTPFAWRASAEARQALAQTEGLCIETDFILTLAQK